MMKSIALLNEAHALDENEYVLVDVEQMEIDDDSYDDCDEELSVLSQSPSLSTSVCSGLFEGSSPPAPGSSTEKNITSSIVSLEEGDDKYEKDENLEGCSEILHSDDRDTASLENTQVHSSREERPSRIEEVTTNSTSLNAELKKGNGSRLSNKKRRKKMKLLKKAMAASAAAVALAEMHTTVPHDPPSVSTSSNARHKEKMSKKVSKKRSQVNNIAVACVTESLSLYRNEHKVKKKTTEELNYVALL